MSDDADDNHVYEAMLIELGPKVMGCFDSSQIRVRTRAGAALIITGIRRQYGSPRSRKEDPRDVQLPDWYVNRIRDRRRRERIRLVYSSSRN